MASSTSRSAAESSTPVAPSVTPHQFKGCACCTCQANKAMKAIRLATDTLDAAHNDWIEQSTDHEGNLYWLLDASEAALKRPLRGRKELRQAVEAIRRPAVTIGDAGASDATRAEVGHESDHLMDLAIAAQKSRRT